MSGKKQPADRGKKQPVPLELVWVKPELLEEHPDNWRIHSPQQVKLVEASVAECGWAKPLLLNTRTDRLLNGHLRRNIRSELLVDGKVPVLRGDWSKEQERLILATLDPLGEAAQVDDEAFAKLVDGLDADGKLTDMLREMVGVADAPVDVAQDDEEHEPADLRVRVGTFTWKVERDVYDAWLEAVRQSAGFSDEAVLGEVFRRLEL